MTPVTASWLVLALFIASWLIAATWVGGTVAAAPPRDQRPLYLAGLLFLGLLGAAVWTWPALWARLWARQPVFDWAMVAACAAGFAVCWWARLHLGRLWSGGVVVKEGHRVVDSGPYGWVRHPIYSGAFLAVTAFAAIRARPGDLLLSAGIIVFFSLKAKLEERFLRAQLGDAYDDYRQRVPMLLPRLR